MENDAIKGRLEVAIQIVTLNDEYLLKGENGHHEQAVCFRLAMYLQGLFPLYHVDAEYNRLGDDPKRRDHPGHTMRPDIIVHIRGQDGPNLLAIEVKKKAKSKDARKLKEAQTKLMELTRPGGSYDYQLGALLEYSTGSSPNFNSPPEWFSNGCPEKS